MRKFAWLRWVTFAGGAITTAVATFGAGLPFWMTVAGPFLVGLATNAEKVLKPGIKDPQNGH